MEKLWFGGRWVLIRVPCALCIADYAEAQTLRQYARRLDEAILDLARTIEEMQPRGPAV